MGSHWGSELISQFIFATGIECSYPTVPCQGADSGKSRRVDEMELTRHYECWQQDFQLTRSMGLQYLRYGPPYYKAHLGPERYDWEFSDATFAKLQELQIIPIADLCHFGVPDWIGDFQNRDWPDLFAEYARAFAKRYPWVRFYTPVNEIFTTAHNSGRKGLWNEALSSDQGFVRALANLCRANLLAMKSISEVNPDVCFVQSEACQYNHPNTPAARRQAHFLNQIRFLSLDLTYAYPIAACMFEYLMDNGMTQKEYDWLMSQNLSATCIMGTDYYGRNEHFVDAQGNRVYSGALLGFGGIIRQYHQRYSLPLMLTETNAYAPDAVRWLRETWADTLRLRMDGLPVVGYTWYSLTDQVDWDSTLVKNNHHVDSFGLYDLDRKPREVGGVYRTLISDWQDTMQEATDTQRRQRW